MEKRHFPRASLTWTALLFTVFLSNTIADNTGPPLPTTTCAESSAPPPQQPLAVRKKTSSANSIEMIGLFDVHEGSRCHLLSPGGMEQTMMTLGVIEDRLQKRLDDDNGTEIGFRAFDTCSNVQTAIQHLIQGLSETGSLNGCKSKFVGVIGPSNPEIQHHVRNLLQSLNIPYFPLQITSLKHEIEAMAEVLVELKWLKVAVFSSNIMLEEEFRQEADRKDICISSSVVLPSFSRSDSFLQRSFLKISATQTQVVIVLGSSTDLQILYETATATNSSVHYWLLAGLESDESVLNLLFGPDHPIILFRRSTAIRVPDRDFSDAYEFGSNLKRLNLVQSYVEYLGNCGQNSSDQMPGGKVKCQSQKFRPMNPLWSVTLEAADKLISIAYKKESSNDTMDNETERQSLQKNETFDREEVEIWTYEHAIGKFSKHKKLQVGHYGKGQLLLNKKRLNVFKFMGSGWFKIPEYHCKNECPETCLNYESISPTPDYNIFSRLYHNWRNETWITVMLTISSLGVLVTAITIIYFTVKAFNDNCEERNQVFNVITLIAIAAAYGCAILFMFHKDSSSCSKRITIVGLAYVGILSPIISRVFLMIAAELEGIHGHVSGLLQSVLCCFIAAVQVALASCFWWMYPNPEQFKYRCIGDKALTLSYLSYIMFLSVLWLAASPFCARSRRNNREGLLMHFGSIAVCLVWIVWFLMFFLMGPKWSEFVVCFGLIATATAVLIVIFLPKVYRMVSMAAAHEQVSMQPVIFASSSSRSPNMSIYESVNHGYNADKDGYVVDVFRDECDSPTPRKMTHL